MGMLMKNERVIAFVDMENVFFDESFCFENYEKVIVFVGSKQDRVVIRAIKCFEASLEVVKVRGVSKNNADFHIAFCMGALSKSYEKSVVFEVVSNDNGFYHLIRNIQSTTGRECRQRKIKKKPSVPRPSTANQKKQKQARKQQEQAREQQEQEHRDRLISAAPLSALDVALMPVPVSGPVPIEFANPEAGLMPVPVRAGATSSCCTEGDAFFEFVIQ